MLIERKEKKSKGLFYLIFTLTIIAALTISCKNKPTGTNEFAWEDETITIPPTVNPDKPEEAPKYEVTQENWSTFIDKTIISKSGFSPDGSSDEKLKNYYLWAKFSASTMKYALTTFDENEKKEPNYDPQNEVFLTLSAISENIAEFKDGKNGQKGQVQFTVNQTTGVIENIKVTFTTGVGDVKPLIAGVDCKFIKEIKL